MYRRLFAGVSGSAATSSSSSRFMGVGKRFASVFEQRSSSGISRGTLLILAGGAAAGVIGVSAVQFAQQASQASSSSTDDAVQRRMRGAYGYVAASLAGTAALSSVLFRSGIAYRIMSMNPWVVGIGSIVATVGTMMATRSIDYHHSPMLKHVALTSFVATQAIMMAPMAALGGPLLMRAAIATGAIVGSLSLTAASAPSQTYLSMTGPIGIGCGVIMGASLGSMFFPGANFLYSIVLWGGLALHGAMLFARTQNLIDGAVRAPRGTSFDPINDALGIYIDTLAIFWRIVSIMQGGSSRKRT